MGKAVAILVARLLKENVMIVALLNASEQILILDGPFPLLLHSYKSFNKYCL